MQIIPILLICLEFVAFSQSELVKIICNYTSKNIPLFGEILACDIWNNIEFKDENISVSISNPDIMKTNNIHLRSFIAKNKEIHCIPTHLGTILPHLMEIIINCSKLKSISTENFEKFKQLWHLDLRWNEIIILKSNLFKWNDNLKTIKLSYNKIQYIYPTTFDHLRSLEFLDLTGNYCYSFNSTAVHELRDIQNMSFCSFELAKVHENVLNANINYTQLLYQLERNPDYFKVNHGFTVNSLLTIIWILLLVFVIILQLIICCKNLKNDSKMNKGESQNLKEIIKNDFSAYNYDDSTYEEIDVKTAIISSEDMYPETSGNKGDEIKTNDDDQDSTTLPMDELYSVVK